MTHAFPIALGTVDLLQGAVLTDRGSIRLSANEIALLAVLHEAHPEPVSAGELLVRAFGYSPKVRSRTVTVTIQRLRKKIEPSPEEPSTVVTVRGVGYRLRLPRAEPVPQPTPSREDPPTGREGDARALDAAFGEGASLVALVGPGGMGKTTLARYWQRRTGALWVDLFEVGRDDTLRRRLVDALDLDDRVPDLDAAIAAGLRGAPGVVLDNAEDLGEAALEALAGWLGGGRVLVTSQRPLGISGERRVLLGELEPDAARRLVEKVRREAGLEPLDGAVVDGLLDQFGGVPLALTVGAPLAEWADLSDGLLEMEAEGQAPHHRSVAQGIGRTLEGLDAEARQVVFAAAAFAGMAPVQAVATVADRPLPRVLGVLASLRARGLVRVEGGRVDLLPLVRILVRNAAAYETPMATATARWIAMLVELPNAAGTLRPFRAEIERALTLATGWDRFALCRRQHSLLWSFGPMGDILPETTRWMTQMPAGMRAAADLQRALAAMSVHRRPTADELIGIVERIPDEQRDMRSRGYASLAMLEAWADAPRAVHWARLALRDLDAVRARDLRCEILCYAGYALSRLHEADGRDHLARSLDEAGDALPFHALMAAMALARVHPTLLNAGRLEALLEDARASMGKVQWAISSTDYAITLLNLGRVDEGARLLEAPIEVYRSQPERMLGVLLLDAGIRLVDRPDALRRLADALAGAHPEAPLLQALSAGDIAIAEAASGLEPADVAAVRAYLAGDSLEGLPPGRVLRGLGYVLSR